MKKFSELPFAVQLGITVACGAVIVLGAEYLYLGDMSTANNDQRTKLTTLKAENDKLRPIEKQFKDLKVDNERLLQQLANLRTIVPDEKEVDNFIRMVQEASVQAGIHVRQYTAKPITAKDFYVEVPFEISLDGNYFTVLQFYDRLSKLSRIINVGKLAMAPVSGSVKGAGRRYDYSSSETVLASCTLTTFCSREEKPVAAPVKR
jgi:type IV pilus assembly protein PilO